MGLFSGAKAHVIGQKAIRTHINANELASDGKVGEAKAKYQEAHRLYEEAMAAGPQKANIRQGFAILLMRLGDFDRAMKIMEEIRLMKDLTENDWFELRLNYSVCLWKKGRLDDAIATGRRAMQLKKCAAIYNTLGMYLVEKAGQTGDFSEIEAFNKESMDYDDEDAGILDNVAAMYEEMMKRADDPGERQRLRKLAKENYAKAHKIKPRQITTLYTLARLYHEYGEDDMARKVLADADSLYYSAVCAVTEDMMDALKREVG